MKTSVKIHSAVTSRIVGKVRAAWGRAVPAIAAYAADQMGRVADAKLTTLASVYKAGLAEAGAVSVQDEELRLAPVGEVPEALERGWLAFDMKPHMLEGASAKPARDGGTYVDVPFTHSISKNPTRLRGMPEEVRRVAEAAVRREKKEAKQEGRRERPRLRNIIGTTGPTERVQKRRTVKGTQKAVVKTRGGIYDNLFRRTRQVGGRTVGAFQTLRRISSNSQAQSWWHPGFRGVRAVKAVVGDVRREAKRIFLKELHREGVDAS